MKRNFKNSKFFNKIRSQRKMNEHEENQRSPSPEQNFLAPKSSTARNRTGLGHPGLTHPLHLGGSIRQQSFAAPNLSGFSVRQTPSKNVAHRRDSEGIGSNNAQASGQKFMTPFSQAQNSHMPVRRTPQPLFGAGRVAQQPNRVQIAALSSKRGLEVGQDDKFFTPASEYSTHKPGLHDHRQSTAIRGFRNANVPLSNLARINEASQEGPKSFLGLKRHTGLPQSTAFGQRKFPPPPTDQIGSQSGFNQSFGGTIPNQSHGFNEAGARHKRKIDSLTPAEQVSAITNIAETIEDIANRQADMSCNDLHIQLQKRSQVPSYEFEPSGLQPYRESPIPVEIQEEIEKQQAKNFKQGVLVDTVSYFIINTKLYLWDTGSSQGQNLQGSFGHPRVDEGAFKMIDAGHRINCVCYVENYASNFKPHLVLVTEEQIELLSFMKKDFSGNRDLKSEINRNNYFLYRLTESEFQAIALELGEVVTQVVQVQKTGRILFASHLENYSNSQIKELHLDGQDNRYLTSVIGGFYNVAARISRLTVGFGITLPRIPENKRLKSSLPHEMSQSLGYTAIQKVVPSPFLSVFSDRKVAIDLQVDEQRNILYVLYSIVKSGANEEVVCHGPTSVEVYDLGTLGDHFSKVTTIYQKAIARAIRASYGVQLDEAADRDAREAAFKQLKIVSIHPITARESSTLHLLIVTKNQLRLYVGFSESLKREAVLVRDQERKGLQYDTLPSRKISHCFKIYNSQTFPNDDLVTEVYSQSLQPFAHTPFGGLKSPQANIFRDSFSIHEQRLAPVYSSDTSSFFYALDSRGGLQSEGLKICAISKNESAFCHNREVVNAGPGGGLQEIPETLCVLEFASASNQNGRQEYVVAIQNSPLSSFGSLSEPRALSRQRMNGYNKALRMHQGWGLSNKNSYLPLDHLERQVYDEPMKLTVLTNKRRIEVVQLSPFDQLIQILKQATRGQQDSLYLSDFEAFATKFPLQDVCNMLAQIFAEGAGAKYLYSRKVEKSNIASQQLQRRQQHMGSRGQPLQGPSGLLGVSSRHRPSASPFSRQFVGSKHSRFGMSQTNRNLDQIDSGSGPDYTLYPYIFGSQDDARGTSEINENCTTTVVNDERVTNLAKDLLVVYGDCIKQHAQADAALSTIRSDALLVYLQRVIRPIWEMSITYRAKDSKFECQTSNMEMLLPALPKLQRIAAAINEYHSELTRATNTQDQARLLGQSPSHIPMDQLGIRTKGILEQGLYRPELEPKVCDQIEAEESQTLLSMQFFVQRCIDVITFLKFASFDGDSDKFESMLMFIFKRQQGKNKEKHKRDVELLKEIADTKFQDLVQQGSGQQIAVGDSLSSIGKSGQGKSRLIKKLFEFCTLYPLTKTGIRGTGIEALSQTEKVQAIEAQTKYIGELCPTLFTAESTTKFVGESVLKQALAEKDLGKQNDLINHAVKSLRQNPTLIDMDAVVPDLCATDNYLKVGQLCLIKIEGLRELASASQSLISSFQVDQSQNNAKILECQSIIFGLVAALNQSITEQKEWKLLSISLLGDGRDSKAKKGTKDYWRKLIFGYLSKLKSDSDVYQLKIQLRHDIFREIEASGSQVLLVELFLMIIEDASPNHQLSQLPKLDGSCFSKVCDELMQRSKFSITCLDFVAKLCLDEARYGNTMKGRLCELAIKLCTENNLKVVKSKAGPGPLAAAKQASNETESLYLTCEQKLYYCQLALDNLPGLDAGVDVQTRRSFSDSLEQTKAALRYAKTVGEEIKKRLQFLESQLGKVDDSQAEFKASLKVDIEALSHHGTALNSLNMPQQQLFEQVESLNLYEMQYSYFSDQIASLLQLGYDHAQDAERVKSLCRRIEETFEKQYKELILCLKMQKDMPQSKVVKSSLDVLTLVSKYCNDQRFSQGAELNGPRERYDVNINKNLVLIMLRESTKQISDVTSLTESIDSLIQGRQLIYANELFCLIGFLYRLVRSRDTQSLRGIEKGSQMHALIAQFSPPVPVPQSEPGALSENNNMRMYKDCCELVSFYLWTNPHFAGHPSHDTSSIQEPLGDSRLDAIKEDLLREKAHIERETRRILLLAQQSYPKPLTLKIEEMIQQINIQIDQSLHQ